jgi:hypothetical protein
MKTQRIRFIRFKIFTLRGSDFAPNDQSKQRSALRPAARILLNSKAGCR